MALIASLVIIVSICYLIAYAKKDCEREDKERGTKGTFHFVLVISIIVFVYCVMNGIKV